jgi:hypothetical protein
VSGVAVTAIYRVGITSLNGLSLSSRSDGESLEVYRLLPVSVAGDANSGSSSSLSSDAGATSSAAIATSNSGKTYSDFGLNSWIFGLATAVLGGWIVG